MRTLTALSLLIALLVPNFGRAEPEIPVASCAARFSGLVDLTSPSVVMSSKKKRALALELETLSQKKAKDMFPQFETILVHGDAQQRLRQVDVDKFNKFFDELWDKRAASGQIPKWEVKEYRKWLKSAPSTQGAYIDIEDAILIDKYISRDYTVTDYIDGKFLDYLETVKFIKRKGANTNEAMRNYLDSTDRSFLRHLGRAFLRRSKALGNTFAAGAIASSAVIVTAFPGELVSAALKPISQPIKDFFFQKAAESATQAVESVKDWASLFVGGEEEYVAALMNLRFRSYRFAGLKLDDMPRAEAVKELEAYLKDTSAELPRFHALVMSEQKNFENIWNKRLEDTKGSVVVVAASHAQYRIAYNQLKSKGDALTTEEREQLAEYEFEMNAAEDFMANFLADWLFFKQVKGEKNPIDAATDRNFATVYEKYMRTMAVDKLSKEINERVKAHVEQLETYSKKVKGKKDAVDPKAPPVAKPEEKTRVETPAIAPKATTTELPVRIIP